jgi:hypothetical protein
LSPLVAANAASQKTSPARFSWLAAPFNEANMNTRALTPTLTLLLDGLEAGVAAEHIIASMGTEKALSLFWRMAQQLPVWIGYSFDKVDLEEYLMDGVADDRGDKHYEICVDDVTLVDLFRTWDWDPGDTYDEFRHEFAAHIVEEKAASQITQEVTP